MFLIGSSAHGMMRVAAGRPCSASRSSPAPPERELGVWPGPGAPGPRGGARPEAPWAPRRPPPLLRLERFQSKGAASLAAALAQSSSRSCSGSSSSFPPAAAPAAGSQQRASAPPPPLLSSPSSRSLPANFPEPRPAAQSSGVASWRNADLGRRARLCPVSHPRAPRPAPRPPERTGLCPGLGTEAKPRRDGWALGFWVRQPQLGLFSCLPPPPEKGTLEKEDALDRVGFGVRHGMRTVAAGFLPGS